MAKNSELIRQWFEEVWNQGREATIDELCAKEAVGHGQTPDGSDVIGPEHFKQFWHNFRSAFTGIHVEIHQTIEEGELVMARWTLTMEHTGSFLGIEPTRKAITAKRHERYAFRGREDRGSLGQLGPVGAPDPTGRSVAGEDGFLREA